jgi:hypothetical protein
MRGSVKAGILGVSLVVFLSLASPAVAEICTVDDVPAATLLLPYFEVDLGNPDGLTTLFSINNASASAAVAHVTVWTDESIPTLDFDIYLTGYDVQTINIRDIFNGNVPRTADAGVDVGDTGNPNDGISNKGLLSQDINFPGSSGPCATVYVNPVLSATAQTSLRNAHTGQAASGFGGLCVGHDYGDNIARGYITVDSVTQCNLLFPSSATYFSSGIADTRNILWGDYFYVDNPGNFAQGETLVHVESCIPGDGFSGYVGNGGRRPGTAGLPWCPFAPGEYTFYGRYAAVAGQDQREPLATTFATRFLNGGPFSGGTDLIVWRDSKTIPTGLNGPHACGDFVGWFPLGQTDAVAFDEQENPQNLCTTTCEVSPCDTAVPTCFPLEAQRISLNGGSPFDDPTPSAAFGWMYLNLNTTVAGVAYPAANPAIAQAWVTTVMDAAGRFSVGFDAIKLDSACQPSNVIFIP